jgi:hypothetical protein
MTQLGRLLTYIECKVAPSRSTTPPMPNLSPAPSSEHCQVIELRQYKLHPGQTEALVTLFDREFVETQESVGMRVIGQFRDLDQPDKFVWLRGFADMASRSAGLQAFYGGPVWAAHRNAANATMIDSDDVLLLKPAWHGAGLATGDRAPMCTAAPAQGLLLALVFHLESPATSDLTAHCRQDLVSRVRAAGALQQGWYVTEPSPNNFPRLPVREGESVVVCCALFGPGRLPSDPVLDDCQHEIQSGLSRWQARLSQRLHTSPTIRSAIHA